MTDRRRLATLALIASLVLAACSSGAASPTPTGSTAPTGSAAEPTPTSSASPTDSSAPTAPVAAVSDECLAPNLTASLKKPPRLTLSTDIPAYPPWWGGDPAMPYPNKPADAPEWELSDPYSMEGYESATAYAIADAMGFAPGAIDWTPNAVFEQAFAPGEKVFDFHLAQISIRAKRAQKVDFSESYLDANQAVLALSGNAITGATKIEDLKDFRLGAAANTTSFDLIESVVQPNVDPLVLNDNAAAKLALLNDQIDGLVVDVQTAIYIRDAELEDFDTPDPEATVVGQFSDSDQVDEVGIVLEKDSPLTACVNEALAVIKSNGVLDAIYDEWISTGQAIPFFE